jgi:hypothetical protein
MIENPNVGDRVRSGSQRPGTILAVDTDSRTAWVLWEDGLDMPMTVSHKYLTLLPEPIVYPERWINVYPDGLGREHDSLTNADQYCVGDNRQDRIGIIHLQKHGTVTLHRFES